MAWMYILECRDGSFYTGSTKNLERRVALHQSGKGAKYTRSRLPVKLVYSEEFEEPLEAFRREKQVQKWSHAQKMDLVLGGNQGDCGH